QLGRRAKPHRGAGVDEGIEVQILFLEKQLEKQPVQPSVQVPIDKPQVIADDIVAKVSEFDALALALAAPFALHAAAEHFARDQLHALQPAEQFWRQQLLNG